MAYKELIGSFDEVRDYIREFFIYGMQHVYIILVIICLLGACLTGIRLILKMSREKNDRS